MTGLERPQRGRAPRLVPIVMVGALATGAVVAAARSSGEASRSVALDAGSAWFASPNVGEVALLHGPTASRIARVAVAEPGEEIEVVQSGADAIVVNRTAGTVERIDGSTLARSAPIMFGTGTEGVTSVIADDDAAWVVHGRGTVLREVLPTSPPTLGSATTVPSGVASLTVAGGDLWTVDGTGTVRVGPPGAPSADRVRDGVAGRLVSVGDRAVAADVGEGGATVTDIASGQVARAECVGTATDAVIAGTGADSGLSWLITVVPVAETLVVYDLDRGACLAPVSLAVDGRPSKYGRPVARGRRIFVPDLTDGTVVVVDPTSTGRPVLARLPLVLDGSAFRLKVAQGFVWFDVPMTDRAGVITDDLEVRAIAKSGKVEESPEREDGGEVDERVDRCVPTPAVALVGGPVAITVPSGHSVPAEGWRWSMPGGDPDDGTGPQVVTRWGQTGEMEVTVVGTTDSVTINATCSVEVVNPDLVTTTTTTPPTEEATTTTTGVATTTAPTTTTAPGGVTTTEPEGDTTATPPPDTTTTAPPPDTTTTVPPETTTTTTTTTSTTIPLDPVPLIDMDPPDPATGETVRFTDATTATHGHEWRIPPGATVVAQTSTYIELTFLEKGDFSVVLAVDNGGPESTATQVVHVDEAVPADDPRFMQAFPEEFAGSVSSCATIVVRDAVHQGCGAVATSALTYVWWHGVVTGGTARVLYLLVPTSSSSLRTGLMISGSVMNYQGFYGEIGNADDDNDPELLIEVHLDGQGGWRDWVVIDLVDGEPTVVAVRAGLERSFARFVDGQIEVQIPIWGPGEPYCCPSALQVDTMVGRRGVWRITGSEIVPNL